VNKELGNTNSSSPFKPKINLPLIQKGKLKMSEIKITDIKDLSPAGSDFFADDEGFITELSEDDMTVWGGAKSGASLSLGLTGKSQISAKSQGSLVLSLTAASVG
jgi:hypothetical protein